MQNLLENSIKYSSKISPFVIVRVFSDKDLVIIEVEDNGMGIGLEHQPKIFEMFYRATKNATGTGLGLYILKRSVDQLNGTVSLQSDLGKGSTFIVKLPH